MVNELSNQVIENDNPSQTLASSLHDVDILSFFDGNSSIISSSSNDTAKGASRCYNMYVITRTINV